MTHLQTLAPIDLRRPSIREPPKLLRFLGSPKLTLALGATLLGLVAAPIAAGAAIRAAPSFLLRFGKGTARAIRPRSVKGAIGLAVGVPTAIGVLASSRKARQFTKTALDPRESFKKGRKIAAIIEDPKKAQDILGLEKKASFKESVITGLKAAGFVGAAAAVAIGGAAALKKGRQILIERKAKKAAVEISSKKELTALGFTAPRPVGLGGVPVSVPVAQQIKPLEAPGALQRQAPIQNIIQISVR